MLLAVARAHRLAEFMERDPPLVSRPLLYLPPLLHRQRKLQFVFRPEPYEILKARSNRSVALAVRARGEILAEPGDVIENVLLADIVEVGLSAGIAELLDGSGIPVDGRLRLIE